MKFTDDMSNIKTHPIYDLYGCDPKTGTIIHIKKSNSIGKVHKCGYYSVSVKGTNTKQRSMLSHRFIWECVNGLIPQGKEIDHKDDVRSNNKIDNLQIMTHQDNVLKSAKNRDYSFVKYNCKKRRTIKSTCDDGSINYHESVSMTSRDTGVNIGIISYTARKLNGSKGGTSKTNGKYYSFEYSDQPVPIRKQVRRPYKKRVKIVAV